MEEAARVCPKCAMCLVGFAPLDLDSVFRCANTTVNGFWGDHSQVAQPLMVKRDYIGEIDCILERSLSALGKEVLETY